MFTINLEDGREAPSKASKNFCEIRDQAFINILFRRIHCITLRYPVLIIPCSLQLALQPAGLTLKLHTLNINIKRSKLTSESLFLVFIFWTCLNILKDSLQLCYDRILELNMNFKVHTLKFTFKNVVNNISFSSFKRLYNKFYFIVV